MGKLSVSMVVLIMLSCGGGENKASTSGTERQTPASANAKRAMDLLEAEMVENGGLTVDNVRIEADSIYATFSLSDEAIEAWNETEKVLGRPPVLAWATVSARVYRGGELLGTHAMRFGQVRKLSPQQRTITVALSRNPARASTRGAVEGLPQEGQAQCTVLAVRVQ